MIYFDFWRCHTRTVGLALSSVLLSLSAHALDLGPITIDSALGEPLRAEIAVINFSAEEVTSFKVEIASPEAFKTKGLEYKPSLASIKVNIQRPMTSAALFCSARSCRTIPASNKFILSLSSAAPINESFIDLLLEVSSSSGRLTRNFAMPFYPPGLFALTSSGAAAPNPAPVNPVAPALIPAVNPPTAAVPAPEPNSSSSSNLSKGVPNPPSDVVASRLVSSPTPESATAPPPLAVATPQLPENAAPITTAAPAGTPINPRPFELGPVVMRSRPGEPLRAEIEIIGISAEMATRLTAKIASLDAFKAKGLTYNTALTNMQVALQTPSDNRVVSCSMHTCRAVGGPGKYLLRLSGEQRITDPVDGLLEIIWTSGGRLLAPFTLSFSPADSMPPKAVFTPVSNERAAASPAPVAQNIAPVPPPADTLKKDTPTPSPAIPHAAEPARKLSPVTGLAPTTNVTASRIEPPAPAPVVAPPVAPPVQRTSKPRRILVKRGDVAGAIASRYKPADTSLDQMLLALLQGNPRAFVSSNVNRLKAGVMLEIPDDTEVEGLNPETALCSIAVQDRSFLYQQLRRKTCTCTPAPSKPSPVSGISKK